MQYKAIWYVLVVVALLLCAGCADQTAQPTTQSQAVQTSSSQSAASASQPSADSPVYVWPSYVPEGMRLSPPESRVASTHEIGSSGMGFYVMVLNGNNHKLSIGGGDIKDTIPITGDERDITAGKLSGKLITNGVYREIVFNVSRGKLFVYSTGLSEAELLKVAESLQPTDLQTLRNMVKG